MAVTAPYNGVRALTYGVSTAVKAVVLDDRLWRYVKSPRGLYVPEADRRLMRRAGKGSGLLVLRRQYSSINGVPDDDLLLTVAHHLWKLDALTECARDRQWPTWVRSVLDANKLEIAVVRPECVTVPWDEYERNEAMEEVIYQAEGIASDAAEEMREAARMRLVADVERRLLRAGVTFTTDPQPLPGAQRHPESGDILNALGKVMTEADVHEDCYGTGVVMSYETLARLLAKIDPRFDEPSK